MSMRDEILNNLKTRLDLVKASNGYATDVFKVFKDEIPMGMSLEPHELPSILLIPGMTKIDPKPSNRINCEWTVYLQLIHGAATDTAMMNFVSDIGKAIFAGSPAADRQDDYRTIHHSIYKLDIVAIEPDLNMIEANRFFIVELNIKFTTKYNDL